MKKNNGFYAIMMVGLLLISTSFLTGCETSEDKDTIETPLNTPDWAKNATIYEVNIRQYSEGGTINAFREHLPRLADMGISILWLMPIHPIGEVERKGTLGSYYSVLDYKGVNPEFGTHEDFRALVEEAHALDMYVILDWVANHTAWDHEWTETNPEFYELNEEGNFIPPRGTDWSDVIQLDYENKDVWEAMTDALEFWVRDFNIDGYRADVADLVPTAFWDQARERLDAIKPVFMLAEAEAPDLNENAFEMSYAWDLHHQMNALAQGEITTEFFDERFQRMRDRFPAHTYMMQFTSNHDENSWNGTVFTRLGDGVKTFAVLASTIEGMPLVYNGQEVGLSHSLEFFEKDLIDWDFDSPFHDFYSKLMHLNRDNRALWNGLHGGPMQRVATSEDESTYFFVRERGDDKVFAALNITGEQVIADVSSELITGTYTELFSEETVTFSSEEVFDLEPWAYRVFVK